ncbi:MAG: hypothetical protein CMD39_10405 [Gammaproteobacteria bacterium]|nr:hypothetical protein [Gammaproteobacteria bacterium]
MLRRLFKGRRGLNDPNPAARRAAVLALDENGAAELAAELERLLAQDPDDGVRQACLARLQDPQRVEALVDDPRLGAAAVRRLVELGGGSDAGVDRPRLLAAELAALPEAERRDRLARIDDADALAALALAARDELRDAVLALPALRRAAGLSALEKASRNRDKTVNRHARRLLDERRTLQHDAAASRARAEELAASLARAAGDIHDRPGRERVHELHRRLVSALDEYAAQREALAAFGERLDDLEGLRPSPADLPALEPEPPPEPAADAQAAAARDDAVAADGPDPFEPLVDAFETLDRRLASAEPFEALAAERQALTERWLTAADQRPPAPAQHAVFESVSHRFRELADAHDRLRQALSDAASAGADALPPLDLDVPSPDWDEVERRRGLVRRIERLAQTVAWPAWAPPAPALAARLDAVGTLRESLQTADRRLEQDRTALSDRLEALTRAIDDGHLADARRLVAEARTLHDALPRRAIRDEARAFARQSARLAELKDWQTFATTPKREALVDAMTALADQPLAPPDQAARIKALRGEWQALGPITQAVDGRLADRFNAAAERAFETCRAWFAEQDAERQANLAERERLCDELARYLEETDWRQADMKAAEKIMRTARQEWRRLQPVDRRRGKAVEQRFEALQNQLHDRVKAEWDRNLALKQAIVAEAEALAADDGDVADKVSRAKALQSRWQAVGITPRRPDQQLWQAFRKACDRVFAARDDARHAADAEIDALAGRLQQVLDGFAASLATTTAETASAEVLRAFRRDMDAADRLPAARRRELQGRVRELTERYQGLLREAELASVRAGLEALARWDAEASRAELEGRAVAELDRPEGLADDIVRARAGTAGAAPADIDTLRRLTVQAELAAGLGSPAEDEPLRLEVQVQRLQAGLSGAGGEESPEAMAAAWCRVGPKDGAAEALRERFFRALTALL